jgi:hypothetical protein
VSLAWRLRPGRFRSRRLAGALLAVGLLAAACGDDGSDIEGDASVQVGEPDAGDLDVEVPDGWRVVPLAGLGFGLALPDAWEDVVLTEAGFEVLSQASPGVEDFVSLAYDAEAAGAVFYAAGTDEEDPERVNDLKVLPRFAAVEEHEVTDAEGLEAFARVVADDEQLDDVDVRPVEGWRFPAVDVRYRASFEDVTAEGVERLVLAPSGMVFSVIVTSDDAEAVDDLAPRLFETFDFV